MGTGNFAGRFCKTFNLKVLHKPLRGKKAMQTDRFMHSDMQLLFNNT